MTFNFDDINISANEFLAIRQRARRSVRCGPLAGVLAAIGWLADGFARASSAVERWARRPLDTSESTPGTGETGTVAGW